MDDPIVILSQYLHLARASQQRNQRQVCDRLLVLSGCFATQLKLYRIAALCRKRVLEHNPGHMLRRWESVDEALANEDFHAFLRKLQRRYPRERVEHLLNELNILIAGERDCYYSDEEYAASLLGSSPEKLDDLFGEAPAG